MICKICCFIENLMFTQHKENIPNARAMKTALGE